MSGGSKSANAGWRYFFGIHMGIGRAIDALHEVRVGDRTAWVGEATENTTINIDAPNLFGGEEKEGGIQGPLEIMMGGPTQTVSAGLQAMRPGPQPGYRGKVTAFFNGLIGMNNPYPKPWKFRVNRIFQGWDGPVFQPSTARIGSRTVSGGETQRAVVPMTSDFTTGTTGTLIPGETSTTGSFTGSGLSLAPGQMAVLSLYSDDIEVTVQRIRCSIEVSDIVTGVPDIPTGPLFYPLAQPFWTGFRWPSPLSLHVPVVFSIEWDVANERVIGRLTLNNEFEYVIDELGSSASIACEYVKSGAADAILNVMLDDVVVLTMPSPVQVAPREFGRFGPSLSSTYSFEALHVGLVTNLSFILKNFRVAGEPNDPVVITGFHSMNPAHIIYECLTNRMWGRGLSSSKLDLESFTTAANRLYAESFGLCLKWTREDSIENFVQMVVDHIGATLYTSRLTGLIAIKLIRDDYIAEELPLYDNESGILEVKEDTVGNVGRSVNTITVTWHDPIEDEDRTVTVKSPGAIISGGGVINAATKSYTGIPTAELALRVAQRDLRAASVSLRRFTLVCDQSLDTMHPGDVFRFRDLGRGIPETVVRVGKVRDGTIIDGKVTLNVAEDVFGLPAVSFSANVPSTWTPPDTRPCIDEQRAFEAPYFLMAGRMSAADLDYVLPDSGYLAVVNSPGRATNAGIQIAVRDGAPTVDDNPPDTSYVCGI